MLQLPASQAWDPTEGFFIRRSASNDGQDLGVGEENSPIHLQLLSLGRSGVTNPCCQSFLFGSRSGKAVPGRPWVGLERVLG